MSGTYLTYPFVSSGSGLTGSATGVPYFVAPLDGSPANPNGGYIGSNAFYFQSATGTFPGLINSASQTFGGVKTFNSAPVFPSLSANAPVRTNGGSTLTVGSTSLVNEVVGNLPLSQTQGSLSLTTQISGILPAANGGTGVGSQFQKGSVVFVDSGPGVYTEDNNNFFYNIGSSSLGVGIKSPASTLHLRKDAPGIEGANLILENNSATVGSTQVGIYLSPNGAGGVIRAASIVSRQTTAGNFSDLGFLTSAAGTPVERLTIAAGGNVTTTGNMGVRTTAPAQALDVVGKIQTKSALLIASSVSGTLTQSVLNSMTSYQVNWPPLQGAAATVLNNDGAGNLNWSPVLQISGSISLTTQVVGNLPLSQTQGSLSLINQVNGYFPSVGIGSVTLTQGFGGTSYPWSLPLSQGSASWLLTNNGAGSLSWVSGLTNPMTTPGDLIVGGGSGTATRYGIGSVGHQLFVNTSPVPQWAPPEYADNFLVNSGFDWWQSFGTTLATTSQNASQYIPDQWYIRNVLGGSNFAGVVACSTGTASLSGSIFSCRTFISTPPTGSSNSNGLEVWGIVDNLITIGNLFNQTASFSIQAKALNNVTSMGIQFFYNTTETLMTGSSSTLTSEFVYNINSASFTLCSMSGFSTANLTVASTGCMAVRLRINGVSAGNTFDLNNGLVLEQAMLNKGSFCSPWKRKASTIYGELIDCMRFYEKSFDPMANIKLFSPDGQACFFASTTQNMRWGVSYKVSKRALSSVSYYNVTLAAQGSWRDSGANNLTMSTINPGLNGFLAGFTSIVTATVQGHWTADARIY